MASHTISNRMRNLVKCFNEATDEQKSSSKVRICCGVCVFACVCLSLPPELLSIQPAPNDGVGNCCKNGEKQIRTHKTKVIREVARRVGDSQPALGDRHEGEDLIWCGPRKAKKVEPRRPLLPIPPTKATKGCGESKSFRREETLAFCLPT